MTFSTVVATAASDPGPSDPALGARFPDMTEVYSRRLRALATEVAATLGIQIEHGIYVAVHGPSYETPAEIRAFRVLGADAVGMSTAPEAIVARQMGLEVLGISCITNMATGIATGMPIIVEASVRSRMSTATRWRSLILLKSSSLAR